MRFRVRVLPLAKADIQESIKWYNHRQEGLGRRFHGEVKQVLEHLASNPFFENRYEDVRCVTLRRFPFMVHFSVDQSRNEVIVHAVFHTSLNTEGWTRRSE